MVAPVLWSAKALRSFLRDPGRGWLRLWIGLGAEAGAACPESEGEPAQAEWAAALAWAFLLASATPAVSVERERLYRLLREMSPDLAQGIAR